MKTVIAKNTWFGDSDLRLDASFHLSEGHLVKMQFVKNKISTLPLSAPEITSKIFYGGRARRIYVNDSINGIPFIKGSDIVKADFSSLKFISRKRTANLSEYSLAEGWSLITRSGTIGNTAYVNKDFINKAASDDIIRVVPSTISSGFLYAYLSSKPGQALLKHGTYGAVIQHIEPEHIANIPVPIFPPEKQEAIHNLIVQAAELRVEANKMLYEAVKLIEDSLPKIDSEKIFNSNLKSLFENNLRLDATTNHTNIHQFYLNTSNSFELKTIGDISEEVFTPGIFKRIRVENATIGIPFLSGSDLLDARPSFDSFLSNKMKNINDYVLRAGWIAVQDAGTIGYVSLINGYLDGVSATNNLIRIVPKKTKDYNPYIFAFLKTSQGQAILKSHEYGSVQKHIDNYQLKDIKVPILPQLDLISDNVSTYLTKTTEACFKETQAITLIETEISQWQQ